MIFNTNFMTGKQIYITGLLCLVISFASCREDSPSADKEPGRTEVPQSENKTADEKKNTVAAPSQGKTNKSKTNISRNESRDTDAAQTGSRKQQLLQLVNNARAKGCRCGGRYYKPVPPLTWNNKLERAAQKHSRYMRRRNVLGHAGQGGSDAGRRISAEGYDWISYGENVAAGYGSDEATIKGWLKSKGHCKNIMSPKFKEMGMASSGQFYTQVFGARR